MLALQGGRDCLVHLFSCHKGKRAKGFLVAGEIQVG